MTSHDDVVVVLIDTGGLSPAFIYNSIFSSELILFAKDMVQLNANEV